MNLTLLITINAVLDTAIIGALAFVMSRSAKLTPHLHGELRLAPVHRRASPTPSGPRRDRVGARLGTALD